MYYGLVACECITEKGHELHFTQTTSPDSIVVKQLTALSNFKCGFTFFTPHILSPTLTCNLTHSSFLILQSGEVR